MLGPQSTERFARRSRFGLEHERDQVALALVDGSQSFGQHLRERRCGRLLLEESKYLREAGS